MARVTYNKSLYRTGFRPYGTTNPYAATLLNGMGDMGLSMKRGPFGPWELGQVPPFTRSGGYKLHGLGQGGGVPDGSILTYQGTWNSTYLMGANDVINAATQAVNADGQLRITGSSSDAGITQATVVGMTIQPGAFHVSLKVQVVNGQGFAKAADAASIIDHFVYQITGVMPQSSIPVVQAPGAPPGATGMPYGVDPSTGLPYGYGAGTDFSSWLQDNLGTVALIGAALLIGVPLLKQAL